MKYQLEKLTKSKAGLLALYQILGGLFGLALFVYLLSMSFQRQIAPYFVTTVIYLVAIATFCYSVFCGIRIFRNESSGLKHSWLNQVVQIFSFSISGYGFQYVSGFFLSVGLDLTGPFLFKVNFGTSMWQFYFNQHFNQVTVAMNIIPILLLVFIDRQLKKINEENFEKNVSVIGEKIDLHA